MAKTSATASAGELAEVPGYRNQLPKPSASAITNELIVAVGWRVFVHDPEPPGAFRGVLATDENGRDVANDLCDGQEVEITAWQPRSRDGVRYRVKRMHDGVECWLRSIYLRRAKTRAVVKAAR